MKRAIFCRQSSLLILVSGGIWLFMGLFLLTKAVLDLLNCWNEKSLFFLLPATLFSIALGAMKGRFVLMRSAKKIIDKIISHDKPTFFKVYGKKEFFLILIMIGMGRAIRYFGVPLHYRFGIYLAIATALLVGSILFFKTVKTPSETTDA